MSFIPFSMLNSRSYIHHCTHKSIHEINNRGKHQSVIETEHTSCYLEETPMDLGRKQRRPPLPVGPSSLDSTCCQVSLAMPHRCRRQHLARPETQAAKHWLSLVDSVSASRCVWLGTRHIDIIFVSWAMNRWKIKGQGVFGPNLRVGRSPPYSQKRCSRRTHLETTCKILY